VISLLDGGIDMSLNGKTILVTGGTGSFGKRFVSTILEQYKPEKLIVFSRDELKQHEMQQTMPFEKGSPVRYFLGDVRDKERLLRAFDGVDIVVHAAALKQIPACEYNPFEAVQTNILGTKNIIDAAIDCGVEKVLALSTDKAVTPANLYGATKLCAERLIIQGNLYSRKGGTVLSCARYGNVMGSRGSVVPLFMKQRETGKVTVTDPRMTRFWISLDHGVAFIVNCINQMQGKEIFVPKIPSLKVMDLVKTIAPDCEIEYIGIRPGEKVHETLISQDEAGHTYDVGDMYVIIPPFFEDNYTFRGKAERVPEDFIYESSENKGGPCIENISEMVDDLMEVGS